MVDICFSDNLSGKLLAIRGETKSDDILSFWINLNHGSVQGDVIDTQLRANAEALRYYFPYISTDELEKAYLEEKERSTRMFRKLNAYLQAGTPVRLWISNTAHDRCALYWFCDYVHECNNEIFVVPSPAYEYGENQCLKPIFCWEQLAPKQIPKHIGSSRLLNENEKELCRRKWRELVAGKSTFRLLTDDAVVGFNDDLLDDLILSHIDTEPRNQTQILGELLSSYHFLDSCFVLRRFEHLIKGGKVKICNIDVDEYGCSRCRTIAKTAK